MGYLSCRAESSTSTCASLSSVATKKHGHPPVITAGGRGGGGGGHSIRHFTYRQMEEATSSFSEEFLLGRGSHGSVYRACLPSGLVVAVKRPSRIRNRHTPVRLVVGGGSFSSTSIGCSSSRNEVENEIEVLSKIHGPRLVNLVGFTTEPDTPSSSSSSSASSSSASSSSASSSFSYSFRKERLLVMEYMANGTLYDLLHSTPRPPGWSRRLRLALQIAKAIHSLHSHHPPVVHRDIKSANVLLDDGHNARLGDFGLAVFDAGTSSPPPAGTLGYLDPGYVTPNNLSTKTDVFSFGILLLEIISGRRAIDVSHSPPSIVEWALPLVRRGNVSSLYDQRIAPPRDPAARRQLAALAAACVRSSTDKRPPMAEIIDRLQILSKTLPLKGWNVGNPCSVVHTETSHSRIKLLSQTTTSPRGSVDFTDDGPQTGTCQQQYRRRISTRVLLFDADSNGTNLRELLNAPDERTTRRIPPTSVSRSKK